MQTKVNTNLSKNKKKVTAYEYLGSTVTKDGKKDGELTNTANKQTKMYYTLNKAILEHIVIDINVRMKLLGIVTIPIIT